MKNNVCLYLSSLSIVRELVEKGILDDRDYKKAEAYLAKKHCIKDKSIYRLNELINDTNYGINNGDGKEGNKNDENHEDRIVKRIDQAT